MTIAALLLKASLARGCRALSQERFADLVRLNGRIRATGQNAAYGPIVNGAAYRFDVQTDGESFVVGAVAAADIPERHDADLGRECEDAHSLWRHAAIATGKAEKEFEDEGRRFLDRLLAGVESCESVEGESA